MKLKETINAWLESRKLNNAKEQAAHTEAEANNRYNIVQRDYGNNDKETYLTLDGERISTDYGDNYEKAVRELFELRKKYQAEEGK